MSRNIDNLNRFAERAVDMTLDEIQKRTVINFVEKELRSAVKWIGARSRRVDGVWVIDVKHLLALLLRDVQPHFPKLSMDILAGWVVEGLVEERTKS